MFCFYPQLPVIRRCIFSPCSIGILLFTQPDYNLTDDSVSNVEIVLPFPLVSIIKHTKHKRCSPGSGKRWWILKPILRGIHFLCVSYWHFRCKQATTVTVDAIISPIKCNIRVSLLLFATMLELFLFLFLYENRIQWYTNRYELL